MMTRSGGNTNDTGSYEQRAIEAREFLDYIQSMELALKRMQAQGCSENDFSFDKDWDGDGDFAEDEGCCGRDGNNPNSPTDLSCHLYALEGGRIPLIKAFDRGWSTSTSGFPYGRFRFSSWNRAPLTDSKGNQYRGIIAGLSDVKESLCLGINETMGVINPNGKPPESDGEFFGGVHFQGTFGTLGPAIFSTSGGEINQKKTPVFVTILAGETIEMNFIM